MWCNVNFVSVFTALNNTKKQRQFNITPYGKIFIAVILLVLSWGSSNVVLVYLLLPGSLWMLDFILFPVLLRVKELPVFKGLIQRAVAYSTIHLHHRMYPLTATKASLYRSLVLWWTEKIQPSEVVLFHHSHRSPKFHYSEEKQTIAWKC